MSNSSINSPLLPERSHAIPVNVDDEIVQDTLHLSRKTLLYACFCCLFVAMLNNTGFCVVVGSSKALSDSIFFTGGLMTLFTFALDAACFLATFFNARYLVKFTPYKRITASCILLFLAYCLLAMSVRLTGSPTEPNYIGFSLALLATIIIGACQAVGEVTNLANLKAFPVQVLGMWGAGTGVAGLLGPALLLLFKSLQISYQNQFFLMIPSSLLMWLFFRELYCLGKRRERVNTVLEIDFMPQENLSPLVEAEAEVEAKSKPKKRGGWRRFSRQLISILRLRKSKWKRRLTDTALLPDFAMSNEVDEAISTEVDAEIRINLKTNKDFKENILQSIREHENLNETATLALTYDNIKRVMASAGSIIFHCAAVYFLEYSIYPGLVDRSSMAHHNASWLNRNIYELSYIAYNIGVTLSRASVSFYPIRRIWILTLLQFFNVIGFIFEAKLHYMASLGDLGYKLMLVWMTFVGLMGGGIYSNCMNLMNTDNKIDPKLRELGVNIIFLLSNIGIMRSTLLFMGLDLTVFKPCHGEAMGCLD
eukprot:g4773.t1